MGIYTKIRIYSHRNGENGFIKILLALDYPDQDGVLTIVDE